MTSTTRCAGRWTPSAPPRGRCWRCCGRVRVFVDCGSTTTHLASLLTADAGIAVITHSLPVAELLVRRGGVTLALISLVLLASGFQMMRVSNHLIDFIWGAFLILVVALNAWRQLRGRR